jgi:hypothetical protein
MKIERPLFYRAFAAALAIGAAAITLLPTATHAQLVVGSTTNFVDDPLGTYGAGPVDFAGGENVTSSIVTPGEGGGSSQAWEISFNPGSPINFQTAGVSYPLSGNSYASLADYTLSFDMQVTGANASPANGLQISLFENQTPSGYSVFGPNLLVPSTATNVFVAGAGYQHFSFPLNSFINNNRFDVNFTDATNFSIGIGYVNYGAGLGVSTETLDIDNLQITMLETALPTINRVFPNGLYQFQATNTLLFTVSSVQGVNPANVVVQLAFTSLTGQSFSSTLTSGNGLTISGPATNLLVATALQSNMLYNVSIQATTVSDTVGSDSFSFDTLITPPYTWEAVDYDYSTNGVTGGLFIDNPQTNAYAGLSSVVGVDCFYANYAVWAAWPYRPEMTDGSGDANPAQEVTADVQRLAYIGTTNIDYDMAFNGTGNWANYTRDYPAGRWNIYMRCAGNPGASNAVAFYQGATNGTGGTWIGQVNIPNTGGWQNWTWEPMQDGLGNLVEWDTDGTTQTLTVEQEGNNFNPHFYMLMPVNTNALPVINPIFPNGLYQFQATNTLSFTVSSVQGVAPTNVVVLVASTNFFGQSSASTLTSGHGLTISGPATNLLVTAALQGNLLYSFFVQATTFGGTVGYATINFDTITPSYTWEAVDYDYNGGSFYDNPQTNAYAGLSSEVGVDSFYPSPSVWAGWPYRPETTDGNGDANPAQEVTADVQRLAYIGTTNIDYDMAFNGAGNWANYTRHYPAGRWNIWMRCAGNPGGADAVAFYQGGTNGTWLGQVNIPNTGGWQNWTWEPMVDGSGNLVEWDTDGTAQILTVEQVGNNFNPHFYMLMPAIIRPNLTAVNNGNRAITVSWAPAGGTLWASPVLGPNANWQMVGTANPAVIATTNSVEFFRVTIP